MAKRSRTAGTSPTPTAQVADEQGLRIRIEYAGVIAVLCLALGLIVGSAYFGGNASSPAQGSALEQLIAEGNAAYDANKPAAAVAAYDKALKMEPHNPDVLTDAGTMYVRLGDPRKGIGYFEQAAREDPKHAKSRFGLGLALMSEKRYDEAAAAFRECLRLSTDGELSQAAKAHLGIVEGKLKKR